MRFYHHPPKIGDFREVTKFLWFSRTIGRETRWLERATIRQQYIAGWDGDYWYDLEFVNV